MNPYRIVYVCIVLLTGCVTTENPPAMSGVDSTSYAACNECHHYPGSILCKTDTVIAGGTAATQCYACHFGSVQLDSVFDSAANAFTYHDHMIHVNGRLYPATGATHANGALNLNFTQCTGCHDYPPASGLHQYHVAIQGNQCYECHFASVESDTDTTNNMLILDEREQAVPGGALLPIPILQRHIDNQVEVSFRKNYQIPYPHHDTLYHWDPATNSCSNIYCHSGIEKGGASVELSSWKAGGQ